MGNRLHSIVVISLTKKSICRGARLGTGAAKCSASTRGNRLPSFASTLTHNLLGRAREEPGGASKLRAASGLDHLLSRSQNFSTFSNEIQMTGNQIDQGAHHGIEARPGRVRSLDVSTRETDGTQEAHTREKSTGGGAALMPGRGRVKSWPLARLEIVCPLAARTRELRLFFHGDQRAACCWPMIWRDDQKSVLQTDDKEDTFIFVGIYHGTYFLIEVKT